MSLVSLTDTATEALAELPLSGPCHTRDEAAHHKDSKETKCILPLKKCLQFVLGAEEIYIVVVWIKSVARLLLFGSASVLKELQKLQHQYRDTRTDVANVFSQHSAGTSAPTYTKPRLYST